MSRFRAALVALTLAVGATVVVHTLADDLLRAACAGWGPDSPLYDYFNCRELLKPDPQG